MVFGGSEIWLKNLEIFCTKTCRFTRKKCDKNGPQLICIVLSYHIVQKIDLTLFLPDMGGISPYISVAWPSPVGIGLMHLYWCDTFTGLVRKSPHSDAMSCSPFCVPIFLFWSRKMGMFCYILYAKCNVKKNENNWKGRSYFLSSVVF